MNSDELAETAENYIVPVLVVTFAFAAYFQQFSINSIFIALGLAITVLVLREIGQNIIAQWMDAYIETELSKEGSALTIMVAILSLITNPSLALIIPFTSSFSQQKYEHWGKSVDAMWSKREYWIALGGITLLTLAALLTLFLGLLTITTAITIFILSQLIPLRDLIIKGNTDGTYILFHSGLTWLVITGANIMILTLALY